MSVLGLTRFSLIDLSNVFDNPSHPVPFLITKSPPMSLKENCYHFDLI